MNTFADFEAASISGVLYSVYCSIDLESLPKPNWKSFQKS